MFNTDYMTALQVHRSRQRELEQRRHAFELTHDQTQPSHSPQAELLNEIRQWMQTRRVQVQVQPQECRDVRPAHAL